MNQEINHYQLTNLYILNRRQQSGNQNIEQQLIERCDQYIKKYSSLVNELNPQDISFTAFESELDYFLKLLESEYLDYMNSDSYKNLCEALNELNKWKAVKLELTSLSE